jgi:uncharacterized protein (TIRG00374 family)
MKKKTLITVIQYIIFLGLGIGIIWYMSSQMSPKDKEDMMSSIRQTRLWYLVPILISGLLAHYFRALRWKLLLKPLQIYPTTVNTTLAVLIGYLVNLLVPRMGEVAKCTVLAKYEKVPPDKMVGTIVAERVFDVVCLGVITLLAFILQAGVITPYLQKIAVALAAKKILLVAVIAVLILFIVLLVYIYRRGENTKVGKIIKGLFDGVRAIFLMKDRGMFLLYTVLVWSMYLAMMYLGFLSLPPTDHLGLDVALVLLVVGSVGMIVTPGGIGAYPLLLGGALEAYNLSKGDGNAFGWVSWSVQTGIVIVLGVIAVIMLPIYNRKTHDSRKATVDQA